MVEERLAGNERVAQIPKWFSRLDSALNDLDAAIGDLHGRTVSVTVQEPPMDGKESTTQPEEALVPVADQLRLMVRRINSFNVSLRGLRDRIEL